MEIYLITKIENNNGKTTKEQIAFPTYQLAKHQLDMSISSILNDSNYNNENNFILKAVTTNSFNINVVDKESDKTILHSYQEISKSDTNNISKANLYKLIGLSYIGTSTQSAKMNYSYKKGVETLCIYLAPWNLSGYQVCPNGMYCKDLCLNGSGHNKADIISNNGNIFESSINKARIKKTKLFYENRELFMELFIKEIIKTKNHAEKNGLDFAVRLNGTSDLSPEVFTYKGKNILEIFPDIQFYDYTKVENRLSLQFKYPNYDLTLSYNGYNWDACKKYLEQGGKVAVVFENELPKLWHGFHVHDANGYDMRYLDEPGTIMGLHFHKVGTQYINGTYHRPDTKFVVKEDDKYCTYDFKELLD